MADGGTASVLRRKTERGRAAAGEAVGPGRALSDAFRRAAEQELQLAVAAGEPRERRATPAELLEGLPEHGFLALLIGPGDGAGLFCLDPAALSAVIEMRTMGRVSARPPLPRRPTATDAAMVADVIDRVLSEFEAPLLETEAARWASGWRYQLFLPEPRPLAVVLEEVSHRVLETEIRFGADGKAGRAIVALPAVGRGLPRRAEPPAPGSAEGVATAAWGRAMAETVETAEATLDAVLGRLRLPLAEVARLAPGDRIALPMSALGRVRLVAPGGKAVAEGRLGQSAGARAVRIGDMAGEPGPQTAEGTVIPAGALHTAFAPRVEEPVASAGFSAASAGRGAGADAGGGSRSDAEGDPPGAR